MNLEDRKQNLGKSVLYMIIYVIICHYSSQLNFLLGLNWPHEAKVFVRGETL